jgi:hypothetical protein
MVADQRLGAFRQQRYVIYFTDEGAVIDTEDAICKDLDFSPCGGDLIGTWKIVTVCLNMTIDDPDGDEDITNPYGFVPECESVVLGADVQWLGSIIFSEDGNYEQDFHNTVSPYYDFPDACLTGLANWAQENDYPVTDSSPEGVCDALNDDEKSNMNCSYASGNCHCTVEITDDEPEKEPEVRTGTFTVDGTSLFMDGSETGVPYCVEGTRAVVEWVPDEQNPQHTILEKQ